MANETISKELDSLNSEIFIAELQPRVEIWNHKLKNAYQRRQSKLEEMASLFNVSVKAIIARYQNLRSTFTKQHKNYLTSQRSGMGTDQLKPPKWKYYSLLLFMKDTVISDEQQDSLPDETSSTSLNQQQEEGASVSDFETDAPTPRPPAPTSAKKRRNSEAPSSACGVSGDSDELADALKMVNEQLMSPKEKEDDNDLFGKLVSQGLRSITSDYGRETCKLRIQQLLIECRFPHNASNTQQYQPTGYSAPPNYTNL